MTVYFPEKNASLPKMPDDYRVCFERMADELEGVEFVCEMKDLDLSNAVATATWTAEWGDAMYDRAWKAEAGLEECERELQVCKALLYQERSRSNYALARAVRENDYWREWAAANTIQVAFLRYGKWQQERFARLASDGEAAANSRYMQLKHARGYGYSIYPTQGDGGGTCKVSTALKSDSEDEDDTPGPDVLSELLDGWHPPTPLRCLHKSWEDSPRLANWVGTADGVAVVLPSHQTIVS